MLKLDQDQRAGIINSIEKVANKTIAPEVVSVIENTDELSNVTVETLVEKGASKTAAKQVVAALELHTALSSVNVSKTRAKKPTVEQTFKAETTEDQRNDIAFQVAALRINAAGSKPRSWRSIREQLGLKNGQFHGVIRHSDGWLAACVLRIRELEEQPDGWTYNGKMDVLTGIENFQFYREELEKMHFEAEVQGPSQALSAGESSE